MRVLFIQHFPLDDMAPAGGWVRDLAKALLEQGHEVHALLVDHDQAAADPFPVTRVVCQPGNPTADLDFPLPRFSNEDGTKQAFATLGEDQLSRYREVLRKKLDLEVERYDPHVIHAQHIWLGGQLALETGVPYVLSAWGPELAECTGAPRLRALAEQAAENASRIFVQSRELADAVQAAFDVGDEQLVIIPPQVTAADPFVEIYRTMLIERFGKAPEE